MHFMSNNNSCLLITGCSGLIGSEAVEYFSKKYDRIVGVDNNMRADFFGPDGDNTWNLNRMVKNYKNFTCENIDIRNRSSILSLLKSTTPNAIIHAAAQPSHDLASKRPFDDFDVNAVGTLNLLESTRQYCPESPFIFMSTNKVYGDRPNTSIEMLEFPTRWDYRFKNSEIAETFSIDQSTHSIFGASKIAADIMVQEYGRYFNIPTCCLRGGCLTGPKHSGVELHGFLSYLIKCNMTSKPYNVYGYKGKQVRDNIHSFDVMRFIDMFIEAPMVSQVYNIGGGRENSTSILEAFSRIENISGKKMNYTVTNQARIGDHICYISNLSKIKQDYPNWSITKSLNDIFIEIYNAAIC